MVDVKSRKCRTEGCGKIPSFGVAGTKTAEYCAQHALDGMVDIMSRKCRTEGCGKIPSFGVAGTKTPEYCGQHTPDGMVDVKSRKCRTERCGKQQSFGVAGTKTAEYCAQHALDGMVNVYKILYKNLKFAVEDFVTLFMGKKSCRWGNVLFGHGFDKLVYMLFYAEEIQKFKVPKAGNGNVFFPNKRARLARADKAVALQYNYQ